MLWGPVQLPGGGDSAVWRDGEIAYGKVYIFDLGGYVNAIDLVTGEIAWTFYAGDAGYDTPFESYPIFGYNAHTIADGKLFLSEGIMYTPPLHPCDRIAINCTDGTLVWKVLQYSSTTGAPVGDGYLISWNSFVLLQQFFLQVAQNHHKLKLMPLKLHWKLQKLHRLIFMLRLTILQFRIH
jgi:hypothetical protein